MRADGGSLLPRKDDLYGTRSNADRGCQLWLPIADISNILGHCDVSFTAKTYALPLEDTHKNAMKLFEEKISDMLK